MAFNKQTAARVRPKKALGQHFLNDEAVADRIAATLDDFRGLPVLEIGPGTGVLTRPLLDRGHDVTVVELDAESVDWLHANMADRLPADRVIGADFLAMDLEQMPLQGPDAQFCVIGNYPYNISSQIFFKVLDWRQHIPCIAGMLQREVAQRLAAAPGTKARGILSVLLQAWYHVEYLFTVDPGKFNPPPKVHSGVVKLTRIDGATLGCDEALWRLVVKTTFGQRRKTLRNSVKALLPPGAALPPEADALLAMRPEQLTVGQFVELTNLIAKIRD